MVDGTDRLGVLRLGLPSGVDGDDPGLRQRCSVVAGLVGHLVATKFAYGDARPSYHKTPVLSAMTSLFLHGSWLHVLGNMLFLGSWQQHRRPVRPAAVSAVLPGCGVVATYGFALANPHSLEVLVGASGAIAGVLGAYLILYLRARV